MHTSRRAIGGFAVAVAIALGVSSAVAALATPPGTPTQVAKAVKASHLITRLSSTLVKKLTTVAADNPGKKFPSTKASCTSMTACVFGKKTATRTVVVMGDSHAQMWLSPLNTIAVAKGVKLVLLYLPQCPAAKLGVWSNYTHTVYPQCTTYRNAWITAINAAHPVSVLLSNRTSDIFSAASGGTLQFTDAQWQQGMEDTITSLAPSKSKIAIIGDIVMFPTSVPPCLASFPAKVQKCASPNPSTALPGHQAAERAAAKAHAVKYVDPLPWACTSTCSPVIGNFIAYSDNAHFTVAYTNYLTVVLGLALRGYF